MTKFNNWHIYWISMGYLFLKVIRIMIHPMDIPKPRKLSKGSGFSLSESANTATVVCTIIKVLWAHSLSRKYLLRKCLQTLQHD